VKEDASTCKNVGLGSGAFALVSSATERPSFFVMLALALQFLPAARQIPFAFFFAAVAVSARICGFGAAIFSTILSAAMADFFLLPPRFSFAVRGVISCACCSSRSWLSSLAAWQKTNQKRDKVADERRAQLAAVVESSEDAIFNKTLDGTILTWNRAAQEMYGYNPEENDWQKCRGPGPAGKGR